MAADAGATQEEVDAALAALTAARDALVPKEGGGKTETIQAILRAVSNSLKGSGADWEVMDMAAYGLGGFMDQDTLITNAMKVYNRSSAPATDYQRVTIALTSLGLDARAVADGAGGTADFIEKIARYNAGAENPSLGTVNAYIFALLAYDAGNYDLPPTANWTREKIIEHLLTTQLGDGGWALGRNYADPDVTAMAISALANYMEDEDVADALAAAVACLSAMQTTNGGFISLGTENSNSASMVIVALAALGIDADTDARFIKAGKSPIDALLGYKTADNRLGYNNTSYNAMATEQGFRALVAYTKMLAAGAAYNIYNFQDSGTPEPQPVDKSELNAKITEAQALNQSDYTAKSWSALAEALAAAKEVATDEAAGQAEVYQATQALIAALNNLVRAGSGDPGGGTVTVSFRLLGDSLHGPEGTRHVYKNNPGSFQTWISATSLTLDSGAVVYDAFVTALEQYGLQWDETQPNYIGGIQAPASFGGHWLYEFDNGPRSGWMYTVNGSHPGVGLRDYVLKNGDAIVWHYTDDYTLEEGSEKWNSGGSGNTSPGSTSGATVTPKITAANGAAAAKLSASDLTSAIAYAKEKGSTAVVIRPAITGEAKKVSVELPKSSLYDLAAATDADLTIETTVGSITIPNSALASIASQAEDGTVTMSLEAVDGSSLTEEQQKAVGDNPVYDISIMSGGVNISRFGGGSLTISLPYTLQEGEDPASVTVWYLSDAGQLEQVACTYDPETGLAAFTTDHLSYYVVGYAEYVEEEAVWTNPFTDVEPTDWFYDHVAFAVQKGLFSGTSDTTFSPNEPMTRAMLVTVLYRLEGEPSVAGTDSFTDVKGGQWYTDAVLWANTEGIVAGYGGGLFGTNDNVTRQQMAAILYRYAEHKGYDVTATTDLAAYSDAPEVSDWARSAMQWANAGGLITGRTASTLVPEGSATRAEVAVILQRFVEGFAE